MTQMNLFQPPPFDIRMLKDLPLFDENHKPIVVLKEGQVLKATQGCGYKFVTEFGEVYVDEAEKV